MVNSSFKIASCTMRITSKINALYKRYEQLLLLSPLVGMGFFVLFYFMAAINYPGGSWIALDQIGFSFWDNYLCDLLDEYAINGELNPGRFHARLALGLLCFALLLLWSHLPRLFTVKSMNKKIMRTSGLLSLIIIFFLASGNHDEIVRLAGIFGVVAFITCAFELQKEGYKKLFALDLFCLSIFMVNYYIYETGIFIETLPVIQKITFVLFLCWFVFLNLALYEKIILNKSISSYGSQ